MQIQQKKFSLHQYSSSVNVPFLCPPAPGLALFPLVNAYDGFLGGPSPFANSGGPLLGNGGRLGGASSLESGLYLGLSG